MNSFKRFSKYRAQKVEIDGIVFASKAEGELYRLLKVMHSEIYCQPKIYLTRAKILYKPDFFCGCHKIYYEMKGIELGTWRLKRRLWMHYGPKPLQVFKLRSNKPFLFETIIPDDEAGSEQDTLSGN